jgi:CubicO group peptidase (beta-lactamase class C family)
VRPSSFAVLRLMASSNLVGSCTVRAKVPEGRSAGSLTWAGIYNTYYWLDPRKRIAAVFMTQVLPFADERVLGVYRQFERGIYAAIRAGYLKAG